MQFANEGLVGSAFSTLEVVPQPDGSLLLAILAGPLLADELRAAFIASKDGEVVNTEVANVFLKSASAKKLVDLITPRAVQVAQGIDQQGEPTGPRKYLLPVTHEEIHLLDWAIKFAEGFIARDPGFIRAAAVYNNLRQERLQDLTSFVTRFNNVHRQARIDDGEEAGLRSDGVMSEGPAPTVSGSEVDDEELHG